MSSELVRFGIAMEESLLKELDALVRQRGNTRSELIRDLVRGEVMKAHSKKKVDAFASVTLVYNHHVRELSERLIEMQHSLGDSVRSTMHVHLDRDRCLEIIVMSGRADRLQEAADKLFATRGVVHGTIDIVATGDVPTDHPSHGADDHDHDHDHKHTHEHAHPPRLAKKSGKTSRRKTR